MQEFSESTGIGKCINLCCECCLECLENICHYINDHALSFMAISGEKFCISAWLGFLLHLKHLIEFEITYFFEKLISLMFLFFLVLINCISFVFLVNYT